MTGVLMRERRGSFEVHRDRPHEDRVRGWGDKSTNLGMPRIADNHQKLEEEDRILRVASSHRS